MLIWLKVKFEFEKNGDLKCKNSVLDMFIWFDELQKCLIEIEGPLRTTEYVF